MSGPEVRTDRISLIRLVVQQYVAVCNVSYGAHGSTIRCVAVKQRFSLRLRPRRTVTNACSTDYHIVCGAVWCGVFYFPENIAVRRGADLRVTQSHGAATCGFCLMARDRVDLNWGESCRAVWCGAVRCGAVQCGAVRCGAVQCGAVR